MDNSRAKWEIIRKLARPKSLAKTVLSAVPYAGPVKEVMSQLDGIKTEGRLAQLQGEAIAIKDRLAEVEKLKKRNPPPLLEWPHAAAEFVKRTITVIAVYDDHGIELFKPLVHGCIISENLVITCVEALRFAQNVTEMHKGRMLIACGLAWYEFELDEIDEGSGLVTCRLTKQDPKNLQERQKHAERGGLFDEMSEPIKTKVKADLAVFIGHEIGMLHTGEAQDVSLLHAFTALQFDTSTVSHFRPTKETGLRSFVSGVLPGRITMLGIPIFTRNASLVGFVSDTESYASDAGRRAIIRSLLLHPVFAYLLKK